MPTYKKVLRRSWTDRDPPIVKLETLKNSVWSKEESVESEPKEEVLKKDPLTGEVKLLL